MLNVVIVNPGDGRGFPSEPAKVHEVEPGVALGKLLARNPGAVAIVLDVDAQVPHLQTFATIGLHDAKRLVNHAFMSLQRYHDGKAAADRVRSVEADRREYHDRIAREALGEE